MITHRNLSKEEKWVSEYESLVKYITEGYEEIIYEYTNDLTCRLFIQQEIEKNNKDILSMEERIINADKELKSILVKTNVCIHGNYPKEYFWFWGVPRNSVELTNEAKSNEWI